MFEIEVNLFAWIVGLRLVIDIPSKRHESVLFSLPYTSVSLRLGLSTLVVRIRLVSLLRV
jgi:hypothetical protein